MAITTTEQTSILNLVVSMFNAAPGAANLTSIAAAYEANGKNMTALANSLAMSSAFTDQFAGLITNEAVANKMAANFGLTTGTAYTNAYNYFVAELAAGKTKATIMKAANDYLIGTHDAMFNDAAATLVNKTTVALDYSVTKQLSGATIADLRAAVSGVDATAASVTTKISAASSTVGSTFTLTTGADVLSGTATVAANVTTSNDDTIYALTDQSLTSADIINGGAGTDSLIASYATAASVASVISNVENITLRQSGNVDTSFDASNTTGLTSLTFDSISSTAGVTAQSATNLASTVTTLGVTNVASTNADTFTFTYADAAVSGTADAVKLNVSAVTAASGVVVIKNTTAANTTAGAGVETVTVNTQGTGTAAASTLASLKSTDNGGATSVLKTLNVTGTSNLTITAALDFASTTGGTINATGMSGNLTVTANNEGMTFTGGTGKNTITTGAFANTLTGGSNDDTFNLAAGTDSVTGGAGNDTVTAAIASLTALDTIALGDGTQDAIIYTDVTALNSTGVVAANLAVLNGYTGVEAIGTAGAITAIDAGYFNQNIFVSASATTAALTMTNVANDTLLIGTSLITTGAADALTASGALPNQTYGLVLKGAAAVTLQASDASAGNSALVIASGISTVNLTSMTTATTAVTNLINLTGTTTATHTIDNVSAGSFVLTGDTALTISKGATAGFTKAVDFNASAFTGVLTIAGSDSADIIKGGTKADIITGLKGADILTGNGGNDVFTFTAIGADFVSGTTAATALAEARTITDFTAGDSIDFGATALAAVAHTATAVSGTASVSATGLATFNSADNTLALKVTAVFSALSTDAVGTSVAFTDGGNTYLAIVGDATAGINNLDAVIKLTGVTAATGLTFTGTDITGVA